MVIMTVFIVLINLPTVKQLFSSNVWKQKGNALLKYINQSQLMRHLFKRVLCTSPQIQHGVGKNNTYAPQDQSDKKSP